MNVNINIIDVLIRNCFIVYFLLNNSLTTIPSIKIISEKKFEGILYFSE